MLKTLIAVQLRGAWAGVLNTGAATRHKKTVAVLLGALVVYAAGCMVFLMAITFAALCAPLAEAGLAWLYFAVAAGTAAAAICLLGMLTAQQSLFSARDNELLLSLPVPPRLILLSRMAGLLLMAYLTGAAVFVPAGVVWKRTAGFAPAALVCFVLGALAVPLGALALACLLGWLLAALAARARHKALFTTAASFLLLGGYLYGTSRISGSVTHLAASAAAAAPALQSRGALLYWTGRALAGHAGALAVLAAVCAAGFGLVYACLSASFYRIAAPRGGARRIVYRETRGAVRRPAAALLAQELRHFGACPSWIVNGGFGAVMALGGGIALLLSPQLKGQLAASLPASLPAAVLLGAGMSFCTAMCTISSAAVSLEAKTRWVLQTAPVPASLVLAAMTELQLVIAVPAAVLGTLAGGAGMGLSAAETGAALLAVLACTVFCAAFDMMCGVLLPYFQWLNETQAVKQSMAVLAAIFAGMAVVFAPAAAYALWLYPFMSGAAFELACAAVYAAAAVPVWLWLRRAGAARFARL